MLTRRGGSKRTIAALVDTEQSNEAIARAERAAALAALAITREEERSSSASAVASLHSRNSVKLRVRGVLFEVEKETLLRVKNTFFCGLLSSGAWQPEEDGAFLIDIPATGFDRILDYLRSDILSVDGLSDAEEQCLYSSLDYLLIPHKRRWQYTTQSVVKRLRARYVIQLKDGILCCANKKDVILWNMDTSAVGLTLKGHRSIINQVIQLLDGRVCSCSDDSTIKLWSIDSGLCQLTLTGHTNTIICITQLIDGRLCSYSWDKTIRVWNVSTGACDMTICTKGMFFCIVQLADGRICCGDDGGTISIYSLSSKECELSWKGHTAWVTAIVCIDGTKICSGSDDSTIKIWNTYTGECERTLEGDSDSATSVAVIYNGRGLCSGSHDCTLKLWNLETGECENTLDTKHECLQVLQLEDGRLLSTQSSGTVILWS